ncbi:MAG TPA: serine/threonine-protein kinase [Pseudonocardiaceae bacterium]|nr:serine/threonine-protein kinase [Pseudonocardiaceae bacterium]
MSDEGRQVGGRYRLDRRIGSGAMGVVWQAYDQRLRRTVAVKQLRLEPGLDPQEANEARERAMREGRIAARLQHPNAVSVFDVVDEDDAPWLVMEYVPSRSLADEMTERGMLPPIEVARIGAQVAHALAAAHAAGIVHRDIKPANILLAETGVVKITDFGISRAQGDVAVTKTGLIAGTPAFLAPEVAYGRSPGGPSDVFSLGSTLYAAVEGQPPFGMSENTLGLLHKVAAGEIDPPRQAGPLTDVLIHLLDADPDQRPDAVAASRWLDSVARGSRPNMPPIGMGPTAVMGGQRPPTARTTPLQPAGRTAVAGAAPMGETRAMTGRTGYQTGVQSGYRTQSGRPAAPPPRRNNRNKLLAGLGVGAVVILGVVLLLSGVFSGKNSPQTTPVDHTTTTTQSQAQNPLPNPVLTPYTISQDTRPPRTEDSATQTTTTETTTTTTQPTTTSSSTTTTETTTTTTSTPSAGQSKAHG